MDQLNLTRTPILRLLLAALIAVLASAVLSAGAIATTAEQPAASLTSAGSPTNAAPVTIATSFAGAASLTATADGTDLEWCDDYNDDPADDCPSGDDDSAVDDDPSDTYSPGDAPPEDPIHPDPGEPLWPPTPTGDVTRLAANGRTAIAPRRAPPIVKKMIRAANRLTRKPYKWGGGHARLRDSGYDCSGAISYVLRSVGLVNGSMVSGAYKSWGEAGSGRWVSVYANKGHMFIVVAGLRFDTSGEGERGPRWRVEGRWTDGFKVRHPARY
ncbi:MAG: hypothetical protein WAP37_00890 [Solirubrobacterales bacterium]